MGIAKKADYYHFVSQAGGEESWWGNRKSPAATTEMQKPQQGRR